MADNDIKLHLTRAEALVLFEFLAHADSATAMPIQHEAEQTVLWKLEGMLESILDEPLKPNYQDLLIAARKAVAGKDV